MGPKRDRRRDDGSRNQGSKAQMFGMPFQKENNMLVAMQVAEVLQDASHKKAASFVAGMEGKRESNEVS